jgi:hypothetical protein
MAATRFSPFELLPGMGPLRPHLASALMAVIDGAVRHLDQVVKLDFGMDEVGERRFQPLLVPHPVRLANDIEIVPRHGSSIAPESANYA